jgi:hypothetical protein
MDESFRPAGDAVEQTLEYEMRLVREAIAMVAQGGAPRVTLAGLRLAEPLLDPARRLATEYGVRIVPLWTSDEAGLDLALEPLADG